MGTIRNEMTIVHHWDKDKLEKLREDAIKVFSQIIRQDAGDEEHIENMIGPIMKSYINQEYTFIINGDCSKIGWETSERFHEERMKWCEKHKYDPQNIIVINFGEGDEPCHIVFDNKAESEAEDGNDIAFYMPPQLEPDKCGNYVVRKPTTKNDLGVDWESYKDVDGNSLDDLILEVLQNNFDCGNTYGYKVADEIIGLLPSVTPQEHRWIPMVRREPTDEEKAEYLAQNGEELCYMFENEMPLNGQEVLVSSSGYVSEDVFDEDFYNFENQDIENVDAWMPLPQPYKAESEEG